ncbi:MGMT family protein [Halobiforma nitratireducens]|uniref:Methylated-DNA--protein-cysteine methyltransferase n=1 Tax=Halobiforma nitratireducens JCM 10879 TaxID=1227454 RepID=M0MB02_9EURY|nr:MGMT family protein [Halobiforma nitratireducens]EMA41824.1 methylated-DNA--protein-cysteine methyltransferase [Halobiforma nitratireducens JCM 10879]
MEDVTDAGIYTRESSYLDRHVQVGAASGRVLRVTFPEHPDEEATEPPEGDQPVLDRIFEYLDGLEEITFDDVQVALTVPTDQRAVLERVQEIPYGDQVGVESLTRMTPELDPDDEDDQILVRTALDANPAPILIPDHRVRDGPSAAPPAVEQKLRSLEGL